MNLLDRLVAAADKLPASHVPPLSQVLPVIGSVVAYLEHGEGFLTAAEKGAEDVIRLYAPEAAAVAEAAAPAAAPVIALAEHELEAHLPAPASAADDSAQRIAELEAELQAAQIALASAQRTQVTTAPIEPAPAPASSEVIG